MIYILIPVHNRKAMTLKCLEALGQQTYKEIKIVVIDDGSTDGTAEEIQRHFPDTSIVHGNGNWWWTRSINEGIKSILSYTTDHDFILFLNDDTEFGPEYLAKLVEASENVGHAIVGSLARNSHDSSVVKDGGVRIDWEHFAFHKEFRNEGRTINPVDTLGGRGTLVPIEVFRKVGLLREKLFPHYAGDYDFFLRTKKSGFPLYISYNAVIMSPDPLKPGRKPFWYRFFHRRSSSNLAARLKLALIHAPTPFLKIKCSILILKRFLAYPIQSSAT